MQNALILIILMQTHECVVVRCRVGANTQVHDCSLPNLKEQSEYKLTILSEVEMFFSFLGSFSLRRTGYK
jgi:hypothetical protein